MSSSTWNDVLSNWSDEHKIRSIKEQKPLGAKCVGTEKSLRQKALSYSDYTKVSLIIEDTGEPSL